MHGTIDPQIMTGHTATGGFGGRVRHFLGLAAASVFHPDHAELRRRLRHPLMLLADLAVIAAALPVTLMLRLSGHVPAQTATAAMEALPVLLIAAVVTLELTRTYRRPWRYVSINDLALIMQTVTICILASAIALFLFGKTANLPKSTPFILWLVMVGGMAGIRIGWRVFTEQLPPAVTAAGSPAKALLLGPSDAVELALRQMEKLPQRKYIPVGVLDATAGSLRLKLRGVPVLGDATALEHAVKLLQRQGNSPEAVLLVGPRDQFVGPQLVRFVAEAGALGLTVARLPAPGEVHSPGELDLGFMDVSAILDRQPATADSAAVASFVANQRVLVTGAGGTIGRELVWQIAAANPQEIILVESSEFNLYSIDQELGEAYPHIRRSPVLCSIRQRGHVMSTFAKYRPHLVFHAAALKHVPLVEENPCAGVQTNVLGTRNVADAAQRYGAVAMVQVSTDKAVNPVGVMGATKRLGELYCQALDLAGRDTPHATRFLTVRFGNVIGSSGSLIPLFQRQLARRMPLTVTHPEINRFFMTVHEAVLLILQGAAVALRENTRHGRIFVLDMGEPIRIIDIARRMISLAGLRPGHDVQIEIVGLRPGEKLYEELFDATECRLASTIPGIFEAEPAARPLVTLNADFDRLEAAAAADDSVSVRQILMEIMGTGAPALQPEAIAA